MQDQGQDYTLYCPRPRLGVQDHNYMQGYICFDTRPTPRPTAQGEDQGQYRCARPVLVLLLH